MVTGNRQTVFEAVLVTGAAGFVGSHVARELLEQRVAKEVRCLCRQSTPELAQLQQAHGDLVKICIGDLEGDKCRATVRQHVAGCDGLIHCAAHYRWWGPPGQAHLYDAVNHRGTEQLMQLALEEGVGRVVHVSTILALGSPAGWGGAARPLLPCTPPGPAASAYARSKAAGDEAVLRMTRGSPPHDDVEVEGKGLAGRGAEEKSKAVEEPGAAPAGVGHEPAEGQQGRGAGQADVAGLSGAAVGVAEGGERQGQGQGQGLAGRRLHACVVCLGCVVGADPRLLQPEADVMRIADLVRGKVAATLGHSTTFTYMGVRDAAAAIVAALQRGQPGKRYLVGNQRLSTGEYYDLIARLAGRQPPRRTVPVWLAAAWAAASAAFCAVAGGVPQAPPDLIRTVAYGTLLYDSSSSEEELQLAVPYRPIEEAFREAVELVQAADNGK